MKLKINNYYFALQMIKRNDINDNRSVKEVGALSF
jgi:hypothetical protein